MSIRAALCLVFAVIFISSVTSAYAEEPTWLFTVPKAKSLKEGRYTVGFIYFDFGVTDNLELGIHGLKYSLPGSADLAVGLSFLTFLSPYLVFSSDIGSGNLYLGLKAAPYIFFAGLEMPVADKVKFVAELNNGLSAGVRIFPARNWTLDIFAVFTSIEVYYKYRYQRIEFEQYHTYPGILVAYSGKL